jgi:hypothetical protein
MEILVNRFPTIPFYRYLKIWKAKKYYYESQDPAITDAFSLNPRTVKDSAMQTLNLLKNDTKTK